MDAVARISLYNTLIFVCLGITLLGLALAAFFFFYFKIPVVYAMMTGKAKQETVRKMAEQNAQTGNLRMRYSVTDETNKKVHTGSNKRKVDIVQPQAAYPQSYAQPVQPEPHYETSVLQTAAPETTILADVVAETELLNRGQAPFAAPAPAVPDLSGFRFDLTETTLVIHTNEII